ncbi:MAG TPA: hypothetical protein VM238_18445 [Phycisphaerae bacterium]|nr:hypothetical protein [Phycisphaerae bacterium]
MAEEWPPKQLKLKSDAGNTGFSPCVPENVSVIGEYAGGPGHPLVPMVYILDKRQQARYGGPIVVELRPEEAEGVALMLVRSAALARSVEYVEDESETKEG